MQICNNIVFTMTMRLSLDNVGGEFTEQIKQFEKLTGTKRDEWETAEFKEFSATVDDKKRKIYKFTYRDIKEFNLVEPFFKKLEAEDPDRLEALKQEHETNKASDDRNLWWDSCQYCGHGIVDPFIIKHEGKKLWMVIGSRCVAGFNNADIFTSMLKQRAEKTLRNALKNWIKPISNSIWDDIQQRKIRVPLLKKSIEFTKVLKELNVDEMSIKEIKDIFKRAEKLELRLPVYVFEIIHPIDSQRERTDELWRN